MLGWHFHNDNMLKGQFDRKEKMKSGSLTLMKSSMATPVTRQAGHGQQYYGKSAQVSVQTNQ